MKETMPELKKLVSLSEKEEPELLDIETPLGMTTYLYHEKLGYVQANYGVVNTNAPAIFVLINKINDNGELFVSQQLTLVLSATDANLLSSIQGVPLSNSERYFLIVNKILNFGAQPVPSIKRRS